MTDKSVIEASFEFEDDEISKLRNVLKNAGSDIIIIVNRDTPDRPWCGTFRNFDFDSDDLHERIYKEFGNGKYYLQSKKGNRYIAGGSLRITIDAPAKKEDPKPDLMLTSMLDTFKKELLELKKEIAGKDSKKDTELEMLEKMKIYKEILGGNNQQIDSAALTRQMIQAMKEGLELGKTIVNPEPPQQDGLMSLVQGFMPILPHILSKGGQQQQPQVIEQKQTAAEEKEEPKNQKDEEMKAHYLSLLPKVRWIASLKDSEEKEEKIQLLIDELFHFYMDIIEIIGQFNDFTQIEAQFGQYKKWISEPELKLARRLFADIKARLKEEK